jgi:CheY-like chemotaxis protein
MKILIAEDAPLLQILNQKLMNRWGYDYDIAANGVEAVDYALKNDGKYDLGLMDIEMPVMDGLEATRMIRKQVKYFPILGYSANHDYRTQCLENGFDEFVEKPATVSSLFKIINELTVKSFLLHCKDNNLSIEQVTPMDSEELKELKALKQKGLTKLKLVGLDHAFVVHKNIQNKISYDLIGEGKEISVFIDRSENEPGRCHLYKVNLHVTKDLFTPEELEEAIKEEDEIAIKFGKATDTKLPE